MNENEFVGAWGGFTVELTPNGEYLVVESGKTFTDKSECFHACIVGDIHG